MVLAGSFLSFKDANTATKNVDVAKQSNTVEMRDAYCYVYFLDCIEGPLLLCSDVPILGYAENYDEDQLELNVMVCYPFLLP